MNVDLPPFPNACEPRSTRTPLTLEPRERRRPIAHHQGDVIHHVSGRRDDGAVRWRA
jgi:hypothetical protein